MLYEVNFLRKIFIPLLKIFNPGLISIKHPYTGSKFFLDAFMHKGYWYRGKKREKPTMQLFENIVKRGETIIDIGGHIGYVSCFLSKLVGNAGKVYVFEPGNNNIPYIERNIKLLSNTVLIKKAVSDTNGIAVFFIENLTGQNNSLLPEYYQVGVNEKLSYTVCKKSQIEVETITLDSFCEQFDIRPNFIKIDVEGAELLAIKGGIKILQNYQPALMVEITQNWSSVLSIIGNENYICFNDNLVLIDKNIATLGNVFCLHKIKHSDILKLLDIKYS